MTTILNALLGLGLLVMVTTYIMYFTALHNLGKALAHSHPALYATFATVDGVRARQNYAALRALHRDKARLASLDPPVQGHVLSTYRYLVSGLGSFVVTLSALLANSLIAKA